MTVRAVTSALTAMLVAGMLVAGPWTMLAGSRAFAETIVVNDKVQVRESNIPRPMRGMRMAEVERQFGAPTTKHPAVGRCEQERSCRTPPITRWDYAAFSVFFERDIVLDSVVTGEQPASGEDHPAGDDHSAPAEQSGTGDHPASAPSTAANDHAASDSH
jgi:hypothetical protein